MDTICIILYIYIYIILYYTICIAVLAWGVGGGGGFYDNSIYRTGIPILPYLPCHSRVELGGSWLWVFGHRWAKYRDAYVVERMEKGREGCDDMV